MDTAWLIPKSKGKSSNLSIHKNVRVAVTSNVIDGLGSGLSETPRQRDSFSNGITSYNRK